MKIPKLTQFKSNLVRLRKDLVNEIRIIDSMLKNINDVEQHNENSCPNCFSRDFRVMLNNEIFCRACGYDSRSKSKTCNKEKKS